MRLRLLLLLALLLPSLAHAEPPRFELIYSQPVETDLKQPLRSPGELWPALFDGATKSIDIEQFYLAGDPGEALDSVPSFVTFEAALAIAFVELRLIEPER